MKRLFKTVLMGILFVFTACVYRTPDTFEGRYTMYSGKKILAMAYRNRTAITNVLEPRLYQSCSSYYGVWETYAAYISEGYTVVYGPTSGNIDLTGQTSSNHKYIVVWQDSPTGTISISLSATLTDSSGSIITNGGDVVILGLLIGDKNEILQHSLNIDLSIANENFQNCLSICFVKINCVSVRGSNKSFNNCSIVCDGISSHLGGSFGNLNNSVLELGRVGTISIDDIENVSIFGNSNFSCSDLVSIGSSLLFAKNAIIKDLDNIYSSFIFGNSDDSQVQNVYLENIRKFRTYIFESGYNYVFGGDITLYSNPSDPGSFKNLIMIPMSNNHQFNFGVSALNFDVIDFDTFVDITADLKIEYVPEETFAGTGTQNYYTLSFTNADVPDEIKNGFGDNRIWVIQREDFESDLLGMTIYNLGFYESGGHTVALDFDSDENFLIMAEDDDGNQAVFLWYDSALWNTIYSDIWPGTDYTVVRCFQLWEPETRTDLRNIFRDYDTNKGMTDSPMTGSIRFNNLDEEIRIEL